MPPEFLLYTSATAALVTAIISGVFLTFSDFVMRSLRATSASTGIVAMQAINQTVYRSLFLALLLGMVPLSLMIAGLAFVLQSDNSTIWLTTGSIIYLFGVFLVTMACNVPMNNKLKAMANDSPAGHSYWPIYSRNWTHWNHLRTIASAAAAFCFLIGTIGLASL